jgi:uncharacterized protein YjiS (DUF1127 family)
MPEPLPGGFKANPVRPALSIPASEENSSTLAILLHGVSVWLDRWRQRRALRDLAEQNDYLLGDVGLTREEALREAAKPFWRA